MKISQLQVKTAIGLSVFFALIMGLVYHVNSYFQTKNYTDDASINAKSIASFVFRSLLLPMSQGQSDIIKTQLLDFKRLNKDLEIDIFDTETNIVWSSEAEKIGKLATTYLEDKSKGKSLENFLKAAKEENETILIDEPNHLSSVLAIKNEPRCVHCHGDSHPIIGAVMVRQSKERLFSFLGDLHVKNLMIMFFSVITLILVQVPFISKIIINPVSEISHGLTAAGGEVNVVAEKVALESKDLSGGVSNQAASLEETSSSLVEMSSTTQSNADNAQQAKNLMDVTINAVEGADTSMKELIISMNEISSSSDETGKIVKTISEIAFQTNLLALNAAVEAARAGSVGAGFAVVAEEVRNLAIRSAEAANNTKTLIDQTVARVKNGSDHLKNTNERFTKAAATAKEAAKFVEEISVASREQAQGVNEITKAINQITLVTQKSAATTEELSSLARRLEQQAHRLRDFVNNLEKLTS